MQNETRMFLLIQRLFSWRRTVVITVLSCWLSHVYVVAYGEITAVENFEYKAERLSGQTGGKGWKPGEGWKTSHRDVVRLLPKGLLPEEKQYAPLAIGNAIVVGGTADRNNPIRRQLEQPYSEQTLFVRFLFRSRFDSTRPVTEGRFAVLWLDEIDGGDGAGHNQFVPNFGVHVPELRPGVADPKQKTRFIVRAGPQQTAFTDIEVEHDRVYLVVGRLSKSSSDSAAPYDQFDLWIDPLPGENNKPQGTVRQRSISAVRWLGLSTGKKTKDGDEIAIGALALGSSWNDVLPVSSGKPATNPIQSPADASEIGLPPEPIEVIDFRTEVYPILRDRCFGCHQGRDASSGHQLDTRSELLGLTQGKPLAVPGQGSQSPLVQVLLSEDEERRMPLDDEPLSAAQISVIRSWIDQGLAWDDELLPEQPLTSDHWAFQPIARPEVPILPAEIADGNAIDAFIAASHQEAGLTMAPRADWFTLARRAKLDLLGLPPTPEEVAALERADSPDHYASWLEQLLASPAHGERWGRHWLDLARWAESQGHQHNVFRPHAWRYRDYVINSFAQDRPFDEFLRQQVAGDELLPYDDENIIATGFLAAARYSDNELDKKVQRNDILVDVVNATASSLMGLTLECAQCHNHKFDPITARDYYRFYGFFLQGQPGNVVLPDSEPLTNPDLAASTSGANSVDSTTFAASVAEQKAIYARVRQRLVDDYARRGAENPENLVITKHVLSALQGKDKQRFDAIAAQIASRRQAWAFYSPVTGAVRLEWPLFLTRWPLPDNTELLRNLKPYVLVRGEPHEPGLAVEPGWPEIFGPTPASEAIKRHPRTALADWLISPNNPLTARVWANRVWQYHFGRGLVFTPNNFGVQGDRPSHPELLDFLACELIDSGWKTSRLHRLIMNSRTYRQSSRFDAAYTDRDPDNRLYWRWLPRRLEGEAIRDSILAVAGTLDEKVGGPSIPLAERETSQRRSVYLRQQRDDLPAMQSIFDGPAALTSCGRRRTSTVSLQALHLLNDPFVFKQAQELADRVSLDVDMNQNTDSLVARIHTAYRLVLSRFPDAEEQNWALAFLKQGQQPSEKQFVYFCHALLNLNEFVYLP